MKNIKISVVTASFNSKNYIKKALESIQKQGYKNIEHLVMDGGSDDGTTDILKKHQGNLRWTSEKDEGIYDALNKGFHQAIGDVFTWLDSDNYYFNDQVLQSVADVFNADPSIDIVVTNSYVCYPDHNNEKILIDNGEPTYEKLLNKGNQFIPESLFYRKELFDKAGGLDQSYKLLADYELWLKMFKLKPKVRKLDIISAVYTVRDDALLRKDPFLAWREAISIGKKYKRSKKARFRIFLRYGWERIKYPIARFVKSKPKAHKFYKNYLRSIFKPFY